MRKRWRRRCCGGETKSQQKQGGLKGTHSQSQEPSNELPDTFSEEGQIPPLKLQKALSE